MVYGMSLGVTASVGGDEDEGAGAGAEAGFGTRVVKAGQRVGSCFIPVEDCLTNGDNCAISRFSLLKISGHSAH
jgi:hypothetical protein